MSKERFELSCCLFNESNMDFIRDKKTNEEYVVLDELVPILNQQAQRIAELEEQLKNSIRPKFKVGDKAYAIIDTMCYTDVFPVDIVGVMLGYKVYDGQFTTYQNYIRVYASKEEALKKLEELKGEKK